MEPLANPAWHALTGPQHNVAERERSAVRYRPAIAPFAALPDDADDDSWRSLAALVGNGGIAILARERALAAPSGWRDELHIPCFQMIAEGVAFDPDLAAHGVDRLGASDAADMLALVEETDPGPFTLRTHELGLYVGIRDGGRLVAMAGERMRPSGHTEISAVCTAPSHRRRGAAEKVVRAVAGSIRARGEVPMLHVTTKNARAIPLYEKLGFVKRREIDVVTYVAPAAG